jgi:thiamine pyrophosphate-dependent acetolactate synthase large subunit-like protein
MNGGQIIAKVLQNHGVKFLFTLCGGHISPIFVGAEQLGIRVIDTRHEATAVFAADAVARLTGVPGVAAVTAGPGITNTITAVKNAQMAQSPLILLGGAAATLLKGRGALQDIDQISLLKPIVKWAVSIRQVKDIAPVMEKAFRIAQSGTPGPVFIECPIDTLYPKEMVLEWYGAKNQKGSAGIAASLKQWYIQRHANQLFKDSEKVTFQSQPEQVQIPNFSQGQLEKAIQMLKKAKKPLMILGSGAMSQPTKVEELASAVRTLGIPVYLSGMGRGLLGPDSDIQMRHKRKEAIKESDLIILAGVPNDFRLDYGNHIGSRPFISIHRDLKELMLNKKPTLPIQADPIGFLIVVSSHFSFEGKDWISKLKQRDAARDGEIQEQSELPTSGLNPLDLLLNLEKNLDQNAVLIADGGDFVATASYTLRPRGALSWLDPGAFGTLGVGAGFAIGAALVYPDRPIWVMFGDGSAGYSLTEFDTFQRHSLRITALVGNDACWTQIARDQVDFLGSDCAVKLELSDYHLVPNAFGGDGIKIEAKGEINHAIEIAKASNASGKSFLINAIIGKTDFRKGSISV